MIKSYNGHAVGIRLAYNGQHVCDDISSFPLDKFFQKGTGRGKKVLIIGESPALNGWIKSGRAFYTTEGKLVPSGRNLNKLLLSLDLTVDICGFTEIVKCFLGKDRKTILNCGIKCWPIFISQLESENFKLIITLGKETIRVFDEILDFKHEIGKLSKVKINQKDYLLLPIYHPSPISPNNHNRNTEIMTQLNNELNFLLQ